MGLGPIFQQTSSQNAVVINQPAKDLSYRIVIAGEVLQSYLLSKQGVSPLKLCYNFLAEGGFQYTRCQYFFASL